MCSVRCGWGFGMFSPARALVLGQVLTAQITQIRSIICTCHLEKLLSSGVEYYPFTREPSGNLGGLVKGSQSAPSPPR